MNKKKFAIISCASVLALGVVSTSLAFYLHLDEKGDITINGEITKNEGGYTIVEKNIGTGVINPRSAIKHTYTLGFEEGVGITQDTLPANIELKVKVDGLDTAEAYNTFFEKYDILMSVKGYNNKSWYLDADEKLPTDGKEGVKTLNIDNDKVTGTFNDADKSFTIFAKEVVFAKNQDLDIDFKMKEGSTIADLKDYAGKNISYTITLSKPEYTFPFIRGNFTGNDLWGVDLDKYMMVPDLEAPEFQYKYIGLPVATKDTFKVTFTQDTVGTKFYGPKGGAEGDPDFKVKDGTEATTVDVFWKNSKTDKNVYTSKPEIFGETPVTPEVTNKTMYLMVEQWWYTENPSFTDVQYLTYNEKGDVPTSKTVLTEYTETENEGRPCRLYTFDLKSDVAQIEFDRTNAAGDWGQRKSARLLTKDIKTDTNILYVDKTNPGNENTGAALYQGKYTPTTPEQSSK